MSNTHINAPDREVEHLIEGVEKTTRPKGKMMMALWRVQILILLMYHISHGLLNVYSYQEEEEVDIEDQENGTLQVMVMVVVVRRKELKSTLKENTQIQT